MSCKARPTNSQSEGDAYDVQRRAALSDPSEGTREMAAGYAKLAEEARTQLELRRWQINECTLRAPHDGVVRQQNLDNTGRPIFSRAAGSSARSAAGTNTARSSRSTNRKPAVVGGPTGEIAAARVSGETFDGTITSAPVSSLAS